MSSRYLLPCPSCQQPIPVAVTQAGETLRCGCGQEILAPTMREIRKLTPAPAHAGPQRATTHWSLQRGMTFVAGALLILAGLLAVWRLLPTRRALDVRRPDFVELDFDVQRLTPLQSWTAWEQFRDQKLDYRDTPQYLENRQRYRELTYYLYGSGAAIAAGSLLAAGAVLLRQTGRPR